MLLKRIEPFTESQAVNAANLRPATKYLGLSLGDRACLALALERSMAVYTCDQPGRNSASIPVSTNSADPDMPAAR